MPRVPSIAVSVSARLILASCSFALAVSLVPSTSCSLIDLPAFASFSDNLEGSFINDYTLKLSKTKTRYIKVKAENYGICPDWHLGAGGKTWLFVDELTIK